jgi:hypothetical protein
MVAKLFHSPETERQIMYATSGTFRLLILLALSCLMVSLSGCGEGRGRLYGKVRYQGKTVVYGTVEVYAEDGSARTGMISTDGSYEVKDIPAGAAKIGITSADRTAKTSLDKTRLTLRTRDASTDQGKPTGWFPLPAALGKPETSGVTTRVSRGSNEFDIELK